MKKSKLLKIIDTFEKTRIQVEDELFLKYSDMNGRVKKPKRFFKKVQKETLKRTLKIVAKN